mmetsp:Transcript_12667/g.17677  ORF Transcript_12667/g.17677 Transcript_12667/m.17677 type:complete len:89 (+) Transcript_12667:449-715(+)
MIIVVDHICFEDLIDKKYISSTVSSRSTQVTASHIVCCVVISSKFYERYPLCLKEVCLQLKTYSLKGIEIEVRLSQLFTPNRYFASIT